jgi:hypothetical protein
MSLTTSQASNEGVIEAPKEGSKNTTQEAESTRVYTQTELDAIAAEVRRKAEAKITKKYEGVDVEHYRSLTQKEEELRIQQAKEKGEFEKILKEQADKANQKISTLTQELTKIKVDGTLLNAASTLKAINPEQVVRLVRDSVKMLESGEVEVLDPKTGRTRYTESGDPMSIDGLVSTFLKDNPHFVTAGPAGGGSQSNTSSNNAKATEVDIAKLDLNDPKQRSLYKELRAKKYPRINV